MGSIKKCYGCGAPFCVHCLKGSHCDPCTAAFDADMDILDDYLDPYEQWHRRGYEAEECTECADVDGEADYGEWGDDY